MSKNTPAQSNPDEPASTPEASEESEPQPMNRAERRAKGKKGGQQVVPGGQPKFTPKGSQSHAQRIWSNRKSGG